MIRFTDFRRQHGSIHNEVKKAIDSVLLSGWYILGEEVKAFEREFADYIGVRYGVGVGSGTEALHLALLACGVGPGDEVISVSHTAVATVAAIEMAGARPVFVDIDPLSFTMNPNLIEAAITARTKAIIPVHLYGHAADICAIKDIVKRFGLRLIEDCAQAHGAEFKGRRVGSFGDIGCFSFYPTKNLGAYGDGGIAVTDDPDLFNRVKLMRQYGWGEQRYNSSIKGINSRLDELQAAILRIKLRHLDAWNTSRIKLAQLYDEMLQNSRTQTIKPRQESHPVYHLFVVCSESRDALRLHLHKNGIETLIHYPIPIHLQRAYSNLGYREGSLPLTEKAARSVLSLPLYPELTEEELKTVAKNVCQFENN